MRLCVFALPPCQTSACNPFRCAWQLNDHATICRLSATAPAPIDSPASSTYGTPQRNSVASPSPSKGATASKDFTCDYCPALPRARPCLVATIAAEIILVHAWKMLVGECCKTNFYYTVRPCLLHDLASCTQHEFQTSDLDDRHSVAPCPPSTCNVARSHKCPGKPVGCRMMVPVECVSKHTARFQGAATRRMATAAAMANLAARMAGW